MGHEPKSSWRDDEFKKSNDFDHGLLVTGGMRMERSGTMVGETRWYDELVEQWLNRSDDIPLAMVLVEWLVSSSI